MSHLTNRSKSPGVVGMPRLVLTNSFEIQKLPTAVFIHYDVVIKPKVPNPRRPDGKVITRVAMEVVARLQSHTAPHIFQPQAIFDGQKNMYSSHRLKFPGGSGGAMFEVNVSDRPDAPSDRSIFFVEIKKAAEVHPKDLLEVVAGKAHSDKSITALQLLNILLRQAALLNHPAHDRRSIYSPIRKLEIGPLEVWRGTFQSVRPANNRMLVNIDISSAVMYRQGPLQDLVMAYIQYIRKEIKDIRQLERLGTDETMAREWRQLKAFLKGVRIEVGKGRSGLPRIRSIDTLEPRAGSYEFSKDDQTMTVQEYFRRCKNTQLRFPNIPGVRTKKGDVIPLEICSVLPHQIYRKMLLPGMQDQVLKFSTVRPQERLERIQAGFDTLDYRNSHFVNQAGMFVSPTPVQVKARLLEAPSLNYGNRIVPGKLVNDKGGAWNMLDNQFIAPGRIDAWAVIDFSGANIGAIQKFVVDMVKCMQKLGMYFEAAVHIREPPIIPWSPQGDVHNGMVQAAKSAMESFRSVLPKGQQPDPSMNPSIIFAILPNNAADIRKDVKQWGDVMKDIPTQCMKTGKLPGNNQYCNNLAMKVNVKLGGINSKITSKALSEFLGNPQVGPAMIVGADVTHPGPGVSRPSVAGLVSSSDPEATKYFAQCSAQSPREEIIDELHSLMVNALNQFMVNFKPRVPPRRILFFRDGVSEGEFHRVAETEVGRIEDALASFWKTNNLQAPRPTITFIVVGKRHHVRFFPRNKAEGDGKSGNCPAGLVVDTGITNPGIFDFFLQSHGGLLGTSRPSHYIVLRDDNNMTADQLQEISYALCHTYARATRSVSIPAPVYYADLVCGRADFHFDPRVDYADETMSAGGEFDLAKWRKHFATARYRQMRRMYYM